MSQSGASTGNAKRFGLRSILLIATFVVTGGWTTFCDASVGSLSDESEANLLGLTFIDADRGWAVGERGVVLHTEDGGNSWKRQSSDSHIGLADVAMFNSQRGLAIGGEYQPYTQLSIGEVLVTEDGGNHWKSVSGHDLPRLRKMLIGPGGKCVAVGDWSPVHLTSVFLSDDGGSSWTPQTSEMTGAMVGIAGTTDDYLVLSEKGEVVRFRLDANPQPIFPVGSQWKAVGGSDGQLLLTGAGGTIVSSDHGNTWRAVRRTETQPPMPQPKATDHVENITTEFPFTVRDGEQASVAIWGNVIWATTDGSRTISVIKGDLAGPSVVIPTTPSLRSLFRLDADRGWAVGDFGSILSTRDGGKTWRLLRGEGRLPALMTVSQHANSIPWTLLAGESFQYNRRVSIVVDSPSSAFSIATREQVRDAGALLGSCMVHSTDSQSTSPTDLIQASSPLVLLLDQSLPMERRSAWTVAAIEHGVQRIIEFGPRGAQTVHTGAAIPATGMLASDVWFEAIARLKPGQLPADKIMLTNRYDQSSGSYSANGLVGNVPTKAAYLWNAARELSRRQIQVLQARTSEQNWLDSLVTGTVHPEEFRSQLSSVLPRMVGKDRERMFARLIPLAAKQGRTDLYLLAMEILHEPDNEGDGSQSPLRQMAGLRIRSIDNSTEWNQTFGTLKPARFHPRQPVEPGVSQVAANQFAVQLSPFETSNPLNQELNQEPGNRLAGGYFRDDQATSPIVRLAGGDSGRSMASGSINPASVDLRWEFHPAVLLVQQAEEQKNMLAGPSSSNSAALIENTTKASTNLRRLSAVPSAGTWGLLASPSLATPVLQAGFASSQPHLDGVFDESWWQKERAWQWGQDGESLRLAHDRQFIYLAVEATPFAGAAYEAPIRQRDTPLDEVSRYRIRLDVDRDLMTAYEFEFDANGNTRDTCDGFAAFDPKWFISITQKDEKIKAEIAIRISDLVIDGRLSQTSWNVSVDRLTGGPANRGLSLPVPTEWFPVRFE